MSTQQSLSVPHGVTLDQLKKQARRLLRSYRDGDGDAREQFARHPRKVAAGEAKLTDAQLVLARGFGFDSWPCLRRHVLGTELRQAIWQRDVKAVRRAVEEDNAVVGDTAPHPMWGGQPTPLQIAAERGQVEVVQLLLQRGADLEDRGTYGWSPLQLAGHWKRVEVVPLLLEAGAAMDIFTASLLGDADAVERLLADDPSLAVTPGLKDALPLHFARTVPVARALVQHGAALDTVDSSGDTPLTSAASERGDRDVGLFLLGQGAPATPFDLAGLGATDRLSKAIDAEVGILSERYSADRATPLYNAVIAGREDTVRLLLQRGADANAGADLGRTPLHVAQSASIARLLLDAGADPAARDDEHGTTPLTWARVGIEISGESPARREFVELLESLDAD